ncbi:MAG: hypothetical protein A3G18_11065 [Rhodospirillales bacterium RIFCSPLOWO2_12_FULL_58_28]|nr:MAG: hypothetical protein A3H92_10210 [Rhodospirillales bacterium RIFCSPLOWO2_02_FULL_58_16]OHC77739.1 MAG: hypothetical protein A3G18_11065 [Rhodospirillales bacterium RIFCSPLOWO2_12_FULL_58_28]
MHASGRQLFWGEDIMLQYQNRISWCIAIFMAIFLLPYQAVADDIAESNKLFVQAAIFVRQADNSDNPVLASELYTKALRLLAEIEAKYPGTDLAVKIASYQQIGAISRNEIEKKLISNITTFRHSQKETEAPQIASSAPVIMPIPQPQEPIVINKASKSEIGSSDRRYFARLGVAHSAPEDLNVELNKEDTHGKATLSENTGFEVALGRNVGSSFKFEFELARRNFDAGSIEGTVTGKKRGSADPSGNVDFYNATLDGYYELPVAWPFKPYVGGGLGGAYVKANDISVPQKSDAGKRTFNNHAWVPSGALMAGINMPINTNLDFDLGYKYMMVGDVTGTRENKSGSSDIIKIHNFMAGLRYYFDQ